MIILDLESALLMENAYSMGETNAFSLFGNVFFSWKVPFFFEKCPYVKKNKLKRALFNR